MCACYLTYDCSDLNNGSGVVQDDHTQRVHLHGSNRQLPHLYPTCCVCARVRACVRVESTTCLCVFALCRRNWAPCDCCGGFCAPVSSFCCNKSTSTQCVFVRRFARAHLCWSACVQLGSTTVALLPQWPATHRTQSRPSEIRSRRSCTDQRLEEPETRRKC